MKKLVVAAGLAALLSMSAMAQSNQGTWNKQKQQSNSTWNQQKENAQEKASGIKDAVDITSGPTVSNVTPNSATLSWTTNKDAATRVRYGTDSRNPGQHAYAAGGSTQHSVQLTNLRPGQTYHYEIENRTGRDRFKGSFQTPR